MVQDKSLVVKDNALINASYDLDLIEQRIILLAIAEARKSGKGLVENTNLRISAATYKEIYKTTYQAAYHALKTAAENLFYREINLKIYTETGDLEHYKTRWVHTVGYVDKTAEIKLIFSPTVVPLITSLERQFTSYELAQVAGLNSKYAIRLYEIVIAWKNTEHKKTPPIPLSELRDQLGLKSNEYSDLRDFKKRVLDASINQVSKYTDILVTYEQHKQGRTITAISLKMTFKKDVVNIDSEPSANPRLSEQKLYGNRRRGLTDKQIAKLAVWKNAFVDQNKHMIKDLLQDYYTIFESFKPLLKDKDQVNFFRNVDAFLNLKHGQQPPNEEEIELTTQTNNQQLPFILKPEVVENSRLLHIEGLSLTQSYKELVRHRKDGENIEQTYERIKDNYKNA